MLRTKTIQYLDIPIKDRNHFLTHLQKNVHEFALHRQNQFLDNNCNAQYFHKDKQSKEKFPVLINALLINSCFTLRAYTQRGIDSLNFYNDCFKKEGPTYYHNIIESTEFSSMDTLETPIIYESNNWIPYRDCKLKGGVFYNTESDTIVNFESRLQGNLLTLFNRVNDQKITFKEKLLQIKPNPKSTMALMAKGKIIKKQTFTVKISIDVQLPTLFSIGQNPAFGNGIFKQVMA